MSEHTPPNDGETNINCLSGASIREEEKDTEFEVLITLPHKARVPNDPSSFKKLSICKLWKKGQCSRSRGCWYSHGEEERMAYVNQAKQSQNGSSRSPANTHRDLRGLVARKKSRTKEPDLRFNIDETRQQTFPPPPLPIGFSNNNQEVPMNTVTPTSASSSSALHSMNYLASLELPAPEFYREVEVLKEHNRDLVDELDQVKSWNNRLILDKGHLEDERMEISKRLKDVKEEIKDVKGENDRLRSERNKALEQVKMLIKNLETADADVKSKATALSVVENQVSHLKARSRNVEDERGRLFKEKTELDAKVRILKEDNERLRERAVTKSNTEKEIVGRKRSARKARTRTRDCTRRP